LPNEYKLVLLCARININNSLNQEIKKLLNNPLDWSKIIEISSCQRVTPFLYYNLNKFNLQDILSQPAGLTIKNYYYANLQRNLIIEKEISRVLKETNLKEISFIPFKGLALLQSLYSLNPGLRIMDDVDILIKKDEFQKVYDILIQSGYRYDADTKKTHEKYQYEFLFSKTLPSRLNLFIEIHTLLNPPRPYEIKLPHLWQGLKEKTVSGEKMRCLSDEDMFLSLAMHLRRHTRRLNLKFIIDIAELLNNADKLDWQYIIKSAKDNRVVTAVYFSIYISQELFNMTISPKILDAFCPGATKKSLIRFVLNKHNFFSLKRWQGTALRFLLFDRFIDFFFYLWQVCLCERILSDITRQRLNQDNKSHAARMPTPANENTKK
ncbi:MAG: nucleotidyltransferase family protein, partial [Candidatus Omnitrophota bacterium]